MTIDEIYEKVNEFLVEDLEIEESKISEDARLKEDLGIDSLDTVEMLMDLEDKIGFEVELDQKVETVGELAAFIESKMG